MLGGVGNCEANSQIASMKKIKPINLCWLFRNFSFLSNDWPNTPMVVTRNKLNNNPKTLSNNPSTNICSPDDVATWVETNCGKNKTKKMSALGLSRLVKTARR